MARLRVVSDKARLLPAADTEKCAASSGSSLRLQPVLPADWPGYSLVYRFGSTLYRIEVIQQLDAPASLSLDGVPLADTQIPLVDDGGEHRIELRCQPG